ncbi:MAG TPA: hypothetical protein VMV29_08885 [Ktedonobacterales bacterium]|nr:hypothetical protein [Ktedonobacterales bacterium]
MWRLLDWFIPHYDLGRVGDYSGGVIHPSATVQVTQARKAALAPVPDDTRDTSDTRDTRDTPPWELSDVYDAPGMATLPPECPGCVYDGLRPHISHSTSAPCDAHLARTWLLQEYALTHAHHGQHSMPLIQLGGQFYALRDYAAVVSLWARVKLHAWQQRNDQGEDEQVVFAVVTADQARMLARDLTQFADYTVIRRFIPLAPGRLGEGASQTGVWKRLAHITSVQPTTTTPQVITPLTDTPWLPTPQPFPHEYPQSWQGESA